MPVRTLGFGKQDTVLRTLHMIKLTPFPQYASRGAILVSFFLGFRTEARLYEITKYSASYLFW